MESKKNIAVIIQGVFLELMCKREIKSPKEVIDDVIIATSDSIYGVIQNINTIRAALTEEAIKIIEEGKTAGKAATLLQIAHRYTDVIDAIISQYKQNQVNKVNSGQINLEDWDTSSMDSHRYHPPISIGEVWDQGLKYSRITHKDYKNDIYTAYEADFIDGFYSDNSLKSRQSSTYSIDIPEVFFKRLNDAGDKLWVDTLIPSSPPSRGVLSTSKCCGWSVDEKLVFSPDSPLVTCNPNNKTIWAKIKERFYFMFCKYEG